jgi:hypothetical protein
MHEEIVQQNQIEARVTPSSKDISLHLMKQGMKHFIVLEVIYNKGSACRQLLLGNIFHIPIELS